MSTHINKKDKILNAALQLFSDSGSKVVSTKKIAIEAKVSEGLIFQHFKNKEGLINALYERELDAIQSIGLKMNSLSHPKVILSETLSLPFLLKKYHFLFCKWYNRIMIDKGGYKNIIPINVINKVEDAFIALNVSNLTAEIDAFWVVFELVEPNGNAFVALTKRLSVMDAEFALKYGEIIPVNAKMTKEAAIAKLKEAKELMELDLMSKEDYDKLRKELSPLIIKN